MPTITTPDGTKLYDEEGRTGTPVVFVHEYVGDHRSWEPQMRHFARGPVRRGRTVAPAGA